MRYGNIPCYALCSIMMYCCTGWCLRGVRRRRRFKNKACTVNVPRSVTVLYCAIRHSIRSHFFCIGAILQKSVLYTSIVPCYVLQCLLSCTALYSQHYSLLPLYVQQRYPILYCTLLSSVTRSVLFNSKIRYTLKEDVQQQVMCRTVQYCFKCCALGAVLYCVALTKEKRANEEKKTNSSTEYSQFLYRVQPVQSCRTLTTLPHCSVLLLLRTIMLYSTLLYSTCPVVYGLYCSTLIKIGYTRKEYLGTAPYCFKCLMFRAVLYCVVLYRRKGNKCPPKVTLTIYLQYN